MIVGHVVAAEMVREATRRRLTDPPRERQPQPRRRRMAHVLHAAALRLDPRIAPPEALKSHGPD